MTIKHPPIYTISIDALKQKLNDLKDLGYSNEEVIIMTIGLPQLFGLSIEKIKERIEFYNSINIGEIVLFDSKQLMQSVELSYARYCFYTSFGVTIDINNYRLLFINEKQFERRYGVTKEQLLLKYQYKNNLENQKIKKKVMLG